MVAFAIAGDRHVHGEDETGETGRPGALHCLFDNGAVLPDIDLEPFGAIGLLRDVLDRGRGEGGEAVDQPGLAGSPGDGSLAGARIEQALGRGRGDNDGGSRLCTHHCGAHVDGGDVDQRLEQDLVGAVAPVIGAQGDFVIAAAIDVVEHHARQTAPREIAQRRNIVGVFNPFHGGEACPPPPAGQAACGRLMPKNRA